MLDKDQTQKGRDYVGALCTLDGEAATISGRLNDFATVGTFGVLREVTFAWPTVARVMANGGEFKS